MTDPALAYGLIVVGLLLMVAEIFLPTGGVLGVLAIAGIITGVTMVFYRDAREGLITLIALFVILPILAPILMHLWPKTPMGRRFILEGPDEDASVAAMPVNLELEQLRGRYGKTLAALRPSGVTDFDGRRVDTITEGEMIDPG